MHGTSHQFQQRLLRSLSAAYAAHSTFNRLSLPATATMRLVADRVPFCCRRFLTKCKVAVAYGKAGTRSDTMRRTAESLIKASLLCGSPS